MLFKFPILLPPGAKLTVTQPYGVTDNATEPKGPNGEPHFHYGVDVVDGDAANTYGTPLVCPFESGKLTGYNVTQFNPGVTPFASISGYGASGAHYEAIFCHISALFFRSSYGDGDIVGLIGNNGAVEPQPTPAAPFAGSHLHLGLKVNGQWADPLEYFDIGAPYAGAPHDPQTNVPRLEWAITQLRAEMSRLTRGTLD